MTWPQISVIIPVRNGERFLAEALKSVVTQTLQPAEIIVVDDGSTDGTAGVVEAFGNGIQLIRQTQKGVSAARNAGIQRQSGELTAFLDADDVWLAEKLERQVAALQANPEAQYALSHVHHFVEPGFDRPAAFNPALLEHDVPGPLPSTFLGRRSVFDVVGPFDETLPVAEDTTWFAAARGLGVEYIMLCETLVRKRVHDRNLSGEAGTNVGLLLELVRRSVNRQKTDDQDA